MISHLTCFACGEDYPWDRLANLCECGKPLRVDYELPRWDKNSLKDREPTLWRYAEMLPPCEAVSLGEGMTPLLWAPRLGEKWYVKDEGLNPTASFKARGMTTAVSMAKHLGATKVAVPSAGNAGGAMAAYAAAAGMEAVVFLPVDTPTPFIVECEALRATIHLVDGLITDCARELSSRKDAEGWFELSTLKEPYRIEGKKTMGYELAEQLQWQLPDVVVYPTGGGTGLIGMWKAFAEMERLGWIGPERPRMVSVQAAGCAPIARAFAAGERFAAEHMNAHTYASGLRVPRAIGDFVMLDLIRASGGTALTVTDEEMAHAVKEIGAATGVFAAPEGGAVLAAAQKLRDQRFIKPEDTVVLFNTGSGLKYV